MSGEFCGDGIQAARADGAEDPIVKRCLCGWTYTLAQFLALPLPRNGRGYSDGMAWRNCHCKSTLAIICPPEVTR